MLWNEGGDIVDFVVDNDPATLPAAMLGNFCSVQHGGEKMGI